MGLFGGSKHKKPVVWDSMWNLKFGDTLYFANIKVFRGTESIKYGPCVKYMDAKKESVLCGKTEKMKFGIEISYRDCHGYFVDNVENPAWYIITSAATRTGGTLIWVYSRNQADLDDAIKIGKEYELIYTGTEGMRQACSNGVAVELENAEDFKWKYLSTGK